MKYHLTRALTHLDKLDRNHLHTLIQDAARNTALLEDVLSSIPGGVIVLRPDHTIDLINTPARRLLPLNSNTTGVLVWEAIASADLAHYIRQALEEDRGADMKDFPLQARQRSAILSCGVLPLVNKGRIVGNMIYLEDVTSRRAEAVRLKRAESLASLTTMSAGVAHEIKNPLASMSIHLQLMRRLAAQSPNGNIREDDLKETLDILEEEVTRLNAIVTDYLFAVRPRDSAPKSGNINSIIRELVQLVRYEAEETNVTIVQKLDKKTPLIPLDEAAMKRAILNLVKNALSAMPNGGELRLGTSTDHSQVHIEIADTGTGIPPDIQDKIFEPYFTTRETGSGLGLTVVYKIVNEHGGDLHIETASGQGTVFRISLPIPQKEKKLLS